MTTATEETRQGAAGWVVIEDSRLRHRWDLKCGCREAQASVYVDPGFYEESGTPICECCGQDRKYTGTEVRQ